MLAITFGSVMKLLALILVLRAFYLRYGPTIETEKSSNLFSASFSIDFFPLLLNITVVKNLKKFEKIWSFFYHSKRNFLMFMLHCAIGITLIIAFEIPGKISISNQKGLTGLYCICSAYSLFLTSRNLFPPTAFEMCGWFEVVFQNIIKLLAVS